MTLDTSRPTAAPDDSPFDSKPRTVGGSARRWLLILLGLAAAALAAWWFTRKAPAPTAAAAHAHGGAASSDSARQPVMLSTEAAERIGVTYAPVVRATLGGEVRTVGLVTWDETRVKTIAPKIDGYVEQLYIAFTGESISEGAPLLRIYSPMLVTAQEELLLAKKLSVDVARAGSSPGDAARDAARDAETLLASARRRLKYWDIPDVDIAQVERTGEVTKTLTLRSPVHGVVVQKNVLSGQRIMAGDAVYQVADLREIWVEGEVFEQDLPTVRLGQRVLVEFAATSGETREGRIVFVAPTLSPDTRTAKIRLRVALLLHLVDDVRRLAQVEPEQVKLHPVRPDRKGQPLPAGLRLRLDLPALWVIHCGSPMSMWTPLRWAKEARVPQSDCSTRSVTSTHLLHRISLPLPAPRAAVGALPWQRPAPSAPVRYRPACRRRLPAVGRRSAPASTSAR